MNKAMRCTAANGDGHRCSRKAGHDELPEPKEGEKDIRAHTAFGQVWGRPRPKRKKKGKK